MTHNENSSAITNGTQGPQKYPHHQKCDQTTAECNQKTPIPVSSTCQVRSEKAKKG